MALIPVDWHHWNLCHLFYFFMEKSAIIQELIPVLGILMSRTHKLMKTPWHKKKEKALSSLPKLFHDSIPSFYAFNPWGKNISSQILDAQNSSIILTQSDPMKPWGENSPKSTFNPAQVPKIPLCTVRREWYNSK